MSASISASIFSCLDILKHTKRADPAHEDCEELEKALAKIKEVMTHLNEEKRRTEGQIHIFDVYSEIENCPASIVSSHRSFVSRVDAIEVSQESPLLKTILRIYKPGGGRGRHVREGLRVDVVSVH